MKHFFFFKPIVKTLPEKPDSSDSDSSDSESLDSDSSDSDSLDSKSVVDEAAIPTNSAESIEESNKKVSDPKNTDEQVLYKKCERECHNSMVFIFTKNLLIFANFWKTRSHIFLVKRSTFLSSIFRYNMFALYFFFSSSHV